MSKNLKNVATVEVPEKALNRLLEITDGLVRMHLELIHLYEQESYLKKHHKAYLHVRDHAEAVCESDKHTISEMLESLHPDKLFAEDDDGDDVMDVFDPKKCADCPCYDECDEYVNRKRVSPGSVAVVMMTTETLGQMQDDMIALTGQIDQLTGIFRNMVAGGSISPEALETVLAGASKLSDEVFDRWDNADMVAML